VNTPQFPVPIGERCFEDYVPGVVYEYGPVRLTEAEIIDFAHKYDPQDIHTNPQKAASGPFGGLIASGWHTVSVVMRLYVENYISRAATLAPPAVDELRWLKPVRPGDSLRIRAFVLESERSLLNPRLGVVRVMIDVSNRHNEIAMTMKIANFLRKRHPQ